MPPVTVGTLVKTSYTKDLESISWRPELSGVGENKMSFKKEIALFIWYEYKKSVSVVLETLFGDRLKLRSR